MVIILKAAFDAGKHLIVIIGETPVTRGHGSLFAFKETIYAKHVNAFTYPPLASLHAHMRSLSVYSDQSQVGATLDGSGTTVTAQEMWGGWSSRRG